MDNIKFVWNGIKINGEFFKCSYGTGPYTAASGLPDDAITMFAAKCKRIPRIPGLTIENNTDIMTDYFETDRIRILPGSPFYEEAKKAMVAHEIHYTKKHIKHLEKAVTIFSGTAFEEEYRNDLARYSEKLAALMG